MNVHAPIPEADLLDVMTDLGVRARAASALMGQLSARQRTEGLLAMAAALRAGAADILSANAEDMAAGRAKPLTPALLDRLELTPERLDGVAGGIESIASLPDPVGSEIDHWTVPSGLEISRVRTPLGVIGIIYESRPNVTADAAALCVRSANAAILRCGSESARTSGAIAAALRAGLEKAGLPADAVQLIPTQDRAAVGLLLGGLGGRVDVVVPRGGRGLVERVQQEARVPVIGHLEGVCHAYVDASAKLDMAVEIVLNAKMRRTGICGALEAVLVDRASAAAFLPRMADALTSAGCELRADEAARAIVPDMSPADPSDWGKEHLAPILSVKLVDGLDGALTHIAAYGSNHTEAIIAEDDETAERFLSEVDAAIVMRNASTQFADGGEFGMGAEIGIATGRIHARGPVGAEQLTIFKYVVRGVGQTRP
ncbi:MAG: glutamate-5-semialdehyde dehydrogenase [Pseudomonadota bacterium]